MRKASLARATAFDALPLPTKATAAEQQDDAAALGATRPPLGRIGSTHATTRCVGRSRAPAGRATQGARRGRQEARRAGKAGVAKRSDRTAGAAQKEKRHRDCWIAPRAATSSERCNGSLTGEAVVDLRGVVDTAARDPAQTRGRGHQRGEDAHPVAESEAESVGEEPLLRPTSPRLACSQAIAPKPEGLVSYRSLASSDVELASTSRASVVFPRDGP
jgi:hypothetical protein